jgi:glutathione S-transferase
MRLYQIPFSHNCIKVRHVLELKGLEYEAVDINPADRREIKRHADRDLVPLFVDDGRAISGSTPIVLHLEQKGLPPALMPEDAEERAECLVLMDWADAVFMALTRRLAYAPVLATGNVGDLFFPDKPVRVRHAAGHVAKVILKRRIGMSARTNREDPAEARRAARVALDRIGGREYLVGGNLTLADITLAAMVGPLQYAAPEVREDPAVAELLDWGREILGKNFSPIPSAERAGV